MADEISYNSPFDNQNLYSTIHYLERDACPYTEKNPHDSITLKGDSQNENDCYYGNYKNPFQDEYKFDEAIEEKENNEDNPDVFSYQIPVSLPKIQEKILQENNCTNLGKTSATSLTLGKKRARANRENNIKSKLSEEKTTKKNSNCGRKKKNAKEKGNHNQLSDDNMIRKIKSNYLKYNHSQINLSFKDKNIQFLKLDSDINENLKKDYNEQLMRKTFKELYETYPVSSKYRKKKVDCSNLNREIINKLYSEENEEKKEHEVIKKLNSTYLELFEEFRATHLNEFLEDIKKALEKNGESKEYIQEYLEKMKKLCMTYEEWFLSKNGRNREKKQK